MPDISMCRNTECPQRKKCYRFMAVPNPGRQFYNAYHPDKDSKCKSFLKILEGDRIRKES